MRDRLATFLRYLARRLFALADRVGPDALTRALDVAYDPPRAWSDRELAYEIRGVRDELAEHEFVGGYPTQIKPCQICGMRHPTQPNICPICGKRHLCGPWTPDKLTAFQRKSKARR